MRDNTAKAKLKAGGTIFGCFTRTSDASLAEFLGYQGWDFIIFDGEHGTIYPNRLEDMVRAVELRNVTPFARVTTNQPHIILRFMDVGVQGVHIPWVNTGEATEQAIQSMKYHPRGNRGLGGARAATFGQAMGYADYIKKANQETMSVIHIETATAVDNINDILAVDGVDVVFIGPSDLSHSLGHAGNPGHPLVQEHIDRVVEATLKTDVALGIIVGNPEAARQWQARGARYIVITQEAIVGPACRNYLASARGE